MSEVEIRIKGEDDSESAFRKARNNEERLAAAAKTAGIDLTVMGKRGEAAGKAIGDGADRGHAGIRRLDVGIAELERGMGTLREEFEKTGDVDFLRQSKRLGQAKRELEGFRKELTGLLSDGGDDAGRGFVGRFMDRLSGGETFARLGKFGSELKEKLIPILVGAGIVASPALGAAVSLAVLGGVGIGGIIGGIALAAKDPAVSATAVEIGNKITSSLTGLATNAFKQPAIESLRILETEYDQLEPRIGRIFDKLAPHVTGLAHGVADGVDRLSVSIERTVDRAGPAIDEIAQDIPILVDGIGRFMDEVSQGGPGAVQFMHDFAIGTRNTLEGVGWLIKELSQLYDFLRNNPLSAFVTGSASALMDLTDGTEHSKKAMFDLKVEQEMAAAAAQVHADALAHLGLGVELASTDFKDLSGQISQTAQTTDALAGAMADKILNTTMSLDQATLGFAESQTHLSAALKQTSIDMDIHHEKSQQMREAILSVVGANIRQYDTMIAAGISAEDAAGAYDSNTAALEKQLRTAGFTKKEIDDLIGKYRGVPSKVNTEIAVEGLTKAIDNLDETIRLINGLHSRTVYVDVVTRHDVRGGPTAYAHGGIVGAAASGGARSNLTMVGERGWELMDLQPGTRVYSHEDSMRQVADMARSSGGGGRQVLEVRPAPGFDSQIMRVFLEMIEVALRTDPAFAGAIAGAAT
jgi:hypothetical protein